MSNDLYQLISNIAGGSLGTVLVFALMYLFRGAFTSWLSVAANIDVEKFKATLGETAEHLKYDLQKDIARSQLYSNSIFSIYPDLFQKVRIAQGIVLNFYGLRYASTWDGFVEVDFEKILSEKNVATGIRQELLSAITSDREAGIKKLEQFLREVEFSDAHKALVEIMNFVMLKEIFITEEIRALALDIHKMLVSAKVDADMARQDTRNPKWMTDMRKTMSDLEPKIDTLRGHIFKELNPPSRKSTT